MQGRRIASGRAPTAAELVYGFHVLNRVIPFAASFRKALGK